MKELLNVAYKNEHKRQILDAFIPDGGKADAVFIYFHGGGLVNGNKWQNPPTIKCLVEENNVALVSANYRLYKSEKHEDYDGKYPEFLQDAAKAIKWVKDNSELFGTDKIFVGGSSAGGYISMMLCFDKRWLEEVGLSNADISGYFHDAGQPTTHFNVLRERGLDHRRVIVDDAAPLYYIGLEKSYPRMRFIVSDNDMPARYEQIMLVVKTLKYFEYPETYDYKVMHGKHCHYTGHADENGYSVWGNMIIDFIKERN